MPANDKARTNQKRATARREHALKRLDLRDPTSPREAATGPTSHAVKAVDPSTRAAIDAFLAARK